MKADQVKAGGFYVNDKKGLVREVVDESSDGDVYWRSYRLSDGRATGRSFVCSKAALARWASRKATKKEIARMQQAEAQNKEQEQSAKIFERIAENIVDVLLKNIPDQRLMEEVRRRKLKM